MIQRSQSLYLFLSTVIMSLLIIKPFANLSLANYHTLIFYSYTVEDIFTDTLKTVMHTFPLFFLVALTTMISFFTIFLFRHRIYQLRLCVLNSFLTLGVLAFMVYDYRTVLLHNNVIDHSFKLPAIFPVICIVLNIMAYQAIHRDELIVKSYDRLR